MVGTKGIEMVLVLLVMGLLQSVVSRQICSEGSEIGRSVTVIGKHGGGTDCSCTLQVSSTDPFAVNVVNFVEMKTPSGCQYALRFEFGTIQRLYSCSQHGNAQYSTYDNDIITLRIRSGSTSSGGFDFGFNITSSKAGTELSLTCSQTPPDPTSTVTSIPTSSASQTTTSSETTTSSTSSSSSGNSQTTASGGGTTSSGGETTASGGGTTASGGGTTASGGGTTASGGETTASGGETTASGGGTTASGGGTTSSSNKPPTPKPSISGNTDEPLVVVPVTTDTAPPQSTKPTTVSTAAIIGATLGAIILFVALAVVLMCCWKKKLNQNKVGAS